MELPAWVDQLFKESKSLIDDVGAGNAASRGAAEDRSIIEVNPSAKVLSKAERRLKVQQSKNEKRRTVQLANAKVHKFQSHAPM